MNDIKEDFLELAKKFELTIGELYSFFAGKIPVDGAIWGKMAWEEKVHASLIDKFAKDYKQKSTEIISNKSILTQMVNSINEIKNYIKGHRSATITRKEAFEKAMQYEKMAVEVHFQNFFSKLNPGGSAEILKILQKEDKKHLERIKQYFGGSNL